MKDRFDLESDINKLFSIEDGLRLLAENVVENNLSNDEITNVLLGLETLLSLQIERLHDTFSQAFKLDEYRTEEVNREQVFKDVGESIVDYLYRDNSDNSKKKLINTINSVKTKKKTPKKVAKKSPKKPVKKSMK